MGFGVFIVRCADVLRPQVRGRVLIANDTAVCLKGVLNRLFNRMVEQTPFHIKACGFHLSQALGMSTRMRGSISLEFSSSHSECSA